MFVPANLAHLACVAAIAGDEATAAAAVGEARAELGGRRQAITAAALRYAEGVIAWHQGRLADAEHLVREATVQWHRGCDRMAACDGIELLGVLAAARERFPDAARLLAAAEAARQPLLYLAPGFTADRAAAARAVSQALGDDRFTQAWEEGQGLTLDDAVAYAARKGGGRKRPATGWAGRHPRRTGGRPPGQRRPAERRHRPAPVHRPRHRQGSPVPHLRQARHRHPRRTRRPGSRQDLTAR